MKKDSSVPASDSSSALKAEAHERALAVAFDENVDSNVRCAAITVALALTACPDCVGVRHDIGDELVADYSGIQTRFSKVGKDITLLGGLRIEYKDSTGAVQSDWLPSLAENSEDHARNVACLRDLKKYYPMARSPIAKAAVLGLAWARLQRFDISFEWRFSYDEPSGNFIECQQKNIGILIQEKDEIARAWYPGMSSGGGGREPWAEQADDSSGGDGEGPSNVDGAQADCGGDENWEGSLDYQGDASSVLNVESLRIFDDSVIMRAEMVNSNWGRCQFEMRLLRSGIGGRFQYAGANVLAFQTKGKGSPIDYRFTFVMSLQREGEDLRVVGVWRESGYDWVIDGFLSPINAGCER
jgi:hypothetical protein